MKKTEYVHPKMHIYEMSKMQLLAGSGETLNIGNPEKDVIPTNTNGTIWVE